MQIDTGLMDLELGDSFMVHRKKWDFGCLTSIQSNMTWSEKSFSSDATIIKTPKNVSRRLKSRFRCTTPLHFAGEA